MGKRQQRKGKRGERELVHVWEQVCAARRGRQERQGDDEPDVITVGLHPRPWVESKIGAHPPLRPALRQATAACESNPDYDYPVACVREDRGRWMALLWLDDLLDLVELANYQPLVDERQTAEDIAGALMEAADDCVE